MIATQKDIPLLREGGTRLARVLEEVAIATVPGVSTAKLDSLAEKLIRDGGDTPSLIGYTPRGAKRPYPATLCVSINEEVVHGIPNENPRLIKEGDIVGLDCVLTHKGVFVDSAITVIAGKGDEAAEDLLSATKEALAAGIAAAKAGAHVGDVSAAVEKVGVKRGYGIVYELGGHGVGNSVHEEPYIPNVGDLGTGEELLEGMVIAIEPMFTEGTPKVQLMPDGYTFVTKDGSRAAHFEHTVLVTKKGAEILTKI
ncbi:type I methionyl aminopeptidase [Candidatus Kaiserbacteria bacterium]|nr:type I methionyl aminopeptidase [Candidatus Kaiserbacteria bacterium]